ncbi:DNA-binding protein VF530 [bacterium]|nr:DNA-binding protein VF530 [bacterium]
MPKVDEKPENEKVETRKPEIKDPLHGVKLADMLQDLVAHYGWEGLAQRVDIRCFKFDPSIKSSLHFLRRTPWARAKVEMLYLKLKTTRKKP